jgi:hypothetical protein
MLDHLDPLEQFIFEFHALEVQRLLQDIYKVDLEKEVYTLLDLLVRTCDFVCLVLTFVVD